MSKINLNLLVALDALLTESNVTMAANKIFITQAAMSNVLRQLRELFNDELLVKNGRRMVLTTRADELRVPLKKFLEDAKELILKKSFDYKNDSRLFVIGMEEYPSIVLLPTLYAYLEKHAPNIKIHVKNIPLFSADSMLEKQEIELGVGLIKLDEPESQHKEILLKEKLVCIGQGNHSLLQKKLSVKNYLSAKHVSYMPSNLSTPNLVDNVLSKLGYTRNVVLRVSHIMAAIYTLHKSDLIATAPEIIAQEAAHVLNFAIQASPIRFPESALGQFWHTRTHNDDGCIWLRSVMKNLANELQNRFKAI